MMMATATDNLSELIGTLPGYDPWATAEGCWFDEEAAQLACDFFPEMLQHVEGQLAGQPFILEDWQRAILANLFGWKRTNSAGVPCRRYREAFIFVPRKNGKTPFCAGICNYVLFCDGEPGAQIYSAAADREQASLLYRHAKGMVEREPMLETRATVYGGKGGQGGHKAIVLNDDTASVYRVLSADADTKHGGNSHLVIVDELHAQPNSELVDVLTTSMASANRRQPLLIYITTADYDRPSICNEKYEYAVKVRDGVISDPTFLPVIYEAHRDDDWTDEAVWKKANPNLGVSVSLDYLQTECRRAQEIPRYQNTFKRLHLNIRTQTDVLWLPLNKWDACDGELGDLAGRECWGGLDLATTTDIAAFVLAFKDGEDVVILPKFWIPRENARERSRRDRVPYEQWIAEGWITATDGDVIDYDVIRAAINELGKEYHVREIGIDRWNATQIATQLDGDGFEVFLHGQGYASMSAPAKEFEKRVVGRTLRHGGNPVLRWMASNVAVEQDAAGNIKPSKKKSTERIDGIVAGVMAVGRAVIAAEDPGPILRQL